jgi:hypothetical protein
MMKKIVFLLLISAVSVSCSFSQATNDAALWMGLTIEKKLNPSLSFEFSEELRFNENISQLNTIFSEVGIGYKIIKRFTISGSYRFTQKRGLDDFYYSRHRYNLEATYRIKVKKIHLTVRERFQSQYKVGSDEDGGIAGNYLRSKLSVKYNTEKKTVPFASIEFWNQLNNPKGNELDNIRYTLGIDYELNKFSSLTFGYIINRQENINDPWTSYIINLGYKYSF